MTVDIQTATAIIIAITIDFCCKKCYAGTKTNRKDCAAMTPPYANETTRTSLLRAFSLLAAAGLGVLLFLPWGENSPPGENSPLGAGRRLAALPPLPLAGVSRFPRDEPPRLPAVCRRDVRAHPPAAGRAAAPLPAPGARAAAADPPLLRRGPHPARRAFVVRGHTAGHAVG